MAKSKDPLALPREQRLVENAEAIERWQKKLFRASRALETLVAQRRRLLKPRPPGGKLSYHEPIGFGGGIPADVGFDDPINF